jgi:drug/metabolite transporter (DMT)-like permease
MMSLKVQIPFWTCTLIWGTTWIVILGQLGTVPPTWSVTYRFLTAGAAMFAYALFTGAALRIGRDGQVFALIFGAAQFVFNFNFVYRAEEHITSGLVAVIFALLIVPNTIFARMFLGTRPSGRFYLGAAIAMAGIGLLFLKEYREAAKGSDAVLLGIGLTMLGVLSASVANVMQATRRAAALPMASLLAWGMLWGTLFNAILAFATVGPPVVETSFTYLGGVLYLGIAASAIAFMAYFSVIRMIGPGPAAYSSVIVPMIAMGISTVFEGYRWTLLAGGGALLTMAGLVIALTARKPST